MPQDPKILGLKNAGIQADPQAQAMTDMRKAHPWIAAAGDFLTGGATDPNYDTGPLDVAGAVLPLAHLGGLNKSLDYVTGLLKEAGYGAEAANPATHALADAFHVPETMPNLDQHVSTSRTTGLMHPRRDRIDLPQGFEMAPGWQRTRQPLTEKEQIWRNWGIAQKKLTSDTRGVSDLSFPEVRQIEQAPTAQSIESLRDVPVSVQSQMKEQAPLIQTEVANKRGKVDRSAQANRTSASKATPEQIRAIQEAAGTGEHTQDSLSKKFPEFTTSAIRAILKMPWK